MNRLLGNDELDDLIDILNDGKKGRIRIYLNGKDWVSLSIKSLGKPIERSDFYELAKESKTNKENPIHYTYQGLEVLDDDVFNCVLDLERGSEAVSVRSSTRDISFSKKSWFWQVLSHITIRAKSRL